MMQDNQMLFEEMKVKQISKQTKLNLKDMNSLIEWLAEYFIYRILYSSSKSQEDVKWMIRKREACLHCGTLNIQTTGQKQEATKELERSTVTEQYHFSNAYSTVIS